MNLRKKRTNNYAVEEFDITSLLDILVILLVFLLKSFNDSELTVDLVKELALPFSTSRGVAEYGPVVQINNRREIFLNDKSIGVTDQEGLSRLSSLLKEEFKRNNENLKVAGRKMTDNKIINLVFDKSLKYYHINSVLDTASNSGYGKYKLIVQGEE